MLVIFLAQQCSSDEEDEVTVKPSVHKIEPQRTHSIPSPGDNEKAIETDTDDVQIDGLEIPRFTKSVPSQILHRKAYTTSYNSVTLNANWTAWHLTADHTSGSYSRKGIDYMEDDEVKGAKQMLDDWDDRGPGIDHGHLCPSGDATWDGEALVQTFLLTNICPQNRKLNQGDWKYLEERCRGWANHYGEIFIVCGPLYYSKPPHTMGKSSVAYPDAFYKVVLRLGKRPAALGFIYPNTDEHRNIASYVKTVDEVEQATGIDFFFQLPDNIENRIEAFADITKW